MVESLPLPRGRLVLAAHHHLLLQEPLRLESLRRLVLDDVDQIPEVPGGEEGVELPGGDGGRLQRRNRHFVSVAEPLGECDDDRLGHGSGGRGGLCLSLISPLEAVVRPLDGRDRGGLVRVAWRPKCFLHFTSFYVRVL